MTIPDNPLAAARQSATPQQRTVQVPVRVRRPWLAAPNAELVIAEYTFPAAASASNTAEDAIPLIRAAGVTVDPRQPVLLSPLAIAKPWGREIWFTGLERRGECSVMIGEKTLPLATYTALAPELMFANAPIVLLKELDPSPEPMRGDLYLEVHAHKREVYVVTAIDRAAWPDGNGALRLGVDAATRARFSDDDAFRGAFLEAVQRYERIRRRIDAAPGDAGAEDTAEEADAWQAMHTFTRLHPLAIGDVVHVSPWVPHSLQHGVRVVEFQTPTYERLIISFGQQVVTQRGWDSSEAIKRLRLDEPPAPVIDRESNHLERIVRFDDFSAWRLTLAAGEAHPFPEQIPYAVATVVRGDISVEGVVAEPFTASEGQAFLVPGPALTRISAARSAVVLLAAPS